MHANEQVVADKVRLQSLPWMGPRCTRITYRQELGEEVDAHAAAYTYMHGKYSWCSAAARQSPGVYLLALVGHGPHPGKGIRGEWRRAAPRSVVQPP